MTCYHKREINQNILKVKLPEGIVRNQFCAPIDASPYLRDLGSALENGVTRQPLRKLGSEKIGVSSIRSKQGVFLFFLKAGFGREDACQIGSFDLAGLVLDLLKCRLPGGKMEMGAGGGRHRLPIVLRTGFAPFAWRTGVTSSRQLAGAEYLCAMVRPGVVLPRSDRGRPVSWLTDPSRRVSTRHPRMSHPVAPSPFC